MPSWICWIACSLSARPQRPMVLIGHLCDADAGEFAVDKIGVHFAFQGTLNSNYEHA
jgi:hypothetical protein